MKGFMILAAIVAGIPEDGLFHGKETGLYQSPVKSVPKTRILCFTAPAWCGPCRAMEADSFTWLRAGRWQIDKTEQADLQIVDIDENPQLAKQYAISTVPTLVILKAGVEVGRSGYRHRGTYEDLIKKLNP